MFYRKQWVGLHVTQGMDQHRSGYKQMLSLYTQIMSVMLVYIEGKEYMYMHIKCLHLIGFDIIFNWEIN